MKKELGIEFEKGVRLLAGFMPSAEKMRKPTLFHGIRVGVFLYERNYSRDIVLAGLLHDIIEFTEVSEQVLEDEFGSAVVTLVLASTKDDTIKDREIKTDELIKRCVSNGQDALIVKAADIIDSFKYYTDTNNRDQLEYCMRNANAIFKYKPSDFADPIFDELKKWQVVSGSPA